MRFHVRAAVDPHYFGSGAVNKLGEGLVFRPIKLNDLIFGKFEIRADKRQDPRSHRRARRIPDYTYVVHSCSEWVVPSLRTACRHEGDLQAV